MVALLHGHRDIPTLHALATIRFFNPLRWRRSNSGASGQARVEREGDGCRPRAFEPWRGATVNPSMAAAQATPELLPRIISRGHRP
jgi:hypothetical protein